MKGEQKMRKKIISMVVAMALVITAICGSYFDKNIEVKASANRNGYALIPEKQDSTGIHTTTSFMFQSQEKLKVEEIKKELTITPDIKFNVNKKDDGYQIIPEQELEKNKLYAFNFKGTTWTFQTMSDFKLLGTLPATETSNVPVDSGIEFYFSHDGAQVKDYFQIEPQVNGSFESHGNVVVFLPKKLEEKTIYTITLKAGLTLEGSTQKLEEDYKFSFETSSKEDKIYKEPKGYFSFKNIINEFNTEDELAIPMSYHMNENATDDAIKAEVYAYKNIDDFINALNVYHQIPQWSMYASEKNEVSKDGLKKVMSFKQPVNKKRDNQQFLNLPEGLSKGYYLIECTWEDISFRTFIQVTDLSFYYMASIDDSLLWISDLKENKGISGAKVTEVNSGKHYTSNNQGIVEIKHEDKNKNKEKNEGVKAYKIQAKDSSAVLLTFNGYDIYERRYQDTNNYWRYFQTDRNLYQPNDKVKFWGFLQHRYTNKNLSNVTVEISQGGWWFWDCLPYFGQDMPYVSEKVKVKKGFYDGELTLPNLDQGHYQIKVKNGEEILASSYIEVEEYEKPAYKLEITKDKEAIFVGEKVNFNVKSMFFEGTPVSNLEMGYNIYGITRSEGETKTDLQGESTISYVPKYDNEYEGITYSNFNIRASLPESGEIYDNESIRIFINDINVDLETKLEDGKGTLTAKVNDIVLDKLNNGTAKDEQDFLGDAVSGHQIKGTIYKKEWKKKVVGQYYDFINKAVRDQYEYYEKTTKMKDITLITDKDGVAKAEVSLPDEENCYYTAKLTTTDLSGRKMNLSSYFGKGWFYPNDRDEYTLTGDKEEYDVDENMTIKFMKNEELLGEGRYLYVTAQNGIKDYDLTSTSSYNKVFDEKSIPNVAIRGIYFNGKTYIESEDFTPRLDIEKNRITITAETDKKEYKPGEECTIKIKAKLNGSNVDVKDMYVNVGIVDEALFSLSDQHIDTLQQLYQWVDDGINMTYASHGNQGNNGNIFLRFTDDSLEESVAFDGEMNNNKMDAGTDDVYIRSEFKDTALFRSIYLDEKGEGKLTFKLPDNVTAWRITLSGISESLKAGSNTEELKVTLPYFISTSLNTTYLVGDKPYIGISAYGNELEEGEEIQYEVTNDKTGFVSKVKGKAFERVNIPLWEMEEGIYPITIKAVSKSGYTDGLIEEIKVVGTYHEMEVADYYELKKGLDIKTNEEGITKLTFTDKGRAQFITNLYGLAYNGGRRVDQKYVAYKARDILKNTFGIDMDNNETVKLSDYQREEGGISILPYSESDVETTVKLLPLIKEDINREKVKMYLYNELQNEESRNKSVALYGLALLEEPVLLQTEKLADITNLTLKDQVYLALTYTHLGDDYTAKVIYDDNIKQYVDSYDNTSRVKYGESEDSYLEYTALVMVLASQLNLDEKDLFYDYVTSHYSKEVLVSGEKITYILNELDHLNEQPLAFKYAYDGKTYSEKIEKGYPITINVPSSKLKDFSIKEVDGEGAVVAIYTKALTTNFQKDEDLTLSRTFINYATDNKSNEFQQSDIVKVKIDWNIDKNAIDDSYIITDYVPSGLKPIDNAWSQGYKIGEGHWSRDIEGQKVTFYVSKDDKEKKPLYYYARVVSPGTFKAEGTMIQGTKVKDSRNMEEDQQVIIKAN